MPRLDDVERKIVSLKPALTVISLSLLIGAGPSLAQSAPGSPLSPGYACPPGNQDSEWHACFDAAVATVKTRQSLGEVQAVDMAAIERIEKEAFGFALPSLPGLFGSQSGEARERECVREIIPSVKSARIQGAAGKVITALGNSQTWQQTDTNSVKSFALRKAKQARVRKAALGSYMLSLDGAKRIS